MADAGPSSSSAVRAGKVPERNTEQWGHSRVTQKDLDSFHAKYKLLPGTRLRASSIGETPFSRTAISEMCFFETPLKLGVRFPLPLSVLQILRCLHLFPTQIVPNGWRVLLGCAVLWPLRFGPQFHLTFKEFMWFYAPIPSFHVDQFWYFRPRLRRPSLIAHSPDNNRGWHKLFFFMSSIG